jgi:hypothetical protein
MNSDNPDYPGTRYGLVFFGAGATLILCLTHDEAAAFFFGIATFVYAFANLASEKT